MEISEVVRRLNQILEDDSMVEDEFVDDFTEIDDSNTVLEPIKDISTVSLTDELDAKAKISKSLDFLKSAIDSFKTTTMVEIDLLKDSAISSAIQNLDSAVQSLESALSGKIEQPVEASEFSDTDDSGFEQGEEESEENAESEEPKEEKESDEDDEESDFEEEAEIDLFK